MKDRDYESGRFRMDARDVKSALSALAAMTLSIPDRDGVLHEFPDGVRGQESVWLDLQFPGIVCTDAEDMARQEYALSADLAYQVQRFGVGVHPGKFGEQNFDLMDLTTAMGVIEESQAAWLRLPKLVRDRYRSWPNVEKAAASGELAQLLKTAGAEAGRSAEAPAVSPSDSAAATPPKGG